MEELNRHYADGRLTPEELSDRLDAALRARTLGELATLKRDLPTSPAPPRRRGRRAGTTAALTLFFLVAVVGAGLVELMAHSPAGVLVALVLLFAAFALVAALLWSLAVTLAPLLALALGARWLARRIAELGGDHARPHPRLRA